MSNDIPSNDEPKCPQCDYLLRGLTSGRCPECGEDVRPERLFALFNSGRPSCAWDSRPGVLSFIQRFLEFTFRPWRFARRMAYVPDQRRARSYSLWCYWYAAVMIGLGLSFETRSQSGNEWVWLLVAIIIAGSVAAWACEATVAGFFALSLSLRSNPVGPRYSFWRTVTHYGSGFLMLSALLGSLALFQAIPKRLLGVNSLLLGWGIALLWWGLSLGAIVAVRTGGFRYAVAAVVLALIVGFGSIVMGYFLGFVVAMIYWRVFGFGGS